MSAVYLDTSALLPIYREEPVSVAVEALLSGLPESSAISSLTQVEFASAVARWVRMKELAEAQARMVEQAFSADLRSGAFASLEVTASHLWQARHWLQRRSTALRTLDALHLACAYIAGLELLTCDRILAEAADVLGVGARLIER